MKGLINLLIYVKKISKICVWLFIIVPCSAFAVSNPFAPPSGKTLLFVGQDRDTVANYVQATGNNIPGGAMFYSSVARIEGLLEPSDAGSAPMDGEALLKSYPNSVIQLGLYMVDESKDTLAGTYDANLKILAQWIKKANRPVYLRIGYEFDNPDNHYDPQEYKQAFRYIVDFLRKEKVENAAYVWHSQCWGEKASQQWMDWYPGDGYVDWFASSLFSIPSGAWISSDFIKLAREHHKPFMIAESAPWGLYSVRAKMDWYKHIFQFIKDQKVDAFCYINSNWDATPMWKGLHIGDSRVEVNADVKDLWLNEINTGNYIKASPDLFRLLGWTKSKK